MTLTAARLRLLLRLAGGERLPQGQVCSGREMSDLAEELLRERLLTVAVRGSRRYFVCSSGEQLRAFLASKDERLRNLEHVLEIFERESSSRASQAGEGGDSKISSEGTAPGFAVNVARPMRVWLDGEETILHPSGALFWYIHDYSNFRVGNDVTVVGVENMENFRRCRDIAYLFPEESIFVCRYPQQNKTHLLRWLKEAGNRFIYFADLDLAGVDIYLTNFYAHLSEQSELFIPADAEERIASGVSKRYDDQERLFGKMKVTDPRVQPLLDLIRRYHKGYDQEGYGAIRTERKRKVRSEE